MRALRAQQRRQEGDGEISQLTDAQIHGHGVTRRIHAGHDFTVRPQTHHPHDHLHETHIHERYTLCYELVRLPQLLKKTQTKVSSSRLCAQKNGSLGQKKKKKPNNLSAHESRGRSLIGRDGGCSRKICGNAPTYRSADSVLHKIFRGRRGCGLNREKPDRKGRRKKCRAEHGQGNVVNNSVINSHSCPQSH